MNQPTKRDPYLGINDGSLGQSGDITERREGLMMMAEHHLLGFGHCMNLFECEGLLHDEVIVKQKLQDLYDTFMKEFDYYAEDMGVGPHDCPMYRIVPKPDELKYTEDKPEDIEQGQREVAA